MRAEAHLEEKLGGQGEQRHLGMAKLRRGDRTDEEGR